MATKKDIAAIPAASSFICTFASHFFTTAIKKTFIILLFGCGSILAQQIIQIGVHAGVNGSILSANMPDYYTAITPGFRGGFFTKFNFGIIRITPEINFSMVGSEGSFANDPNRFYSAKTNTLEIPVLIGLRIVNSKTVNFRVQFGGFWAWNATKSIVVHDNIFPQNDSSITSTKGTDFNGGIVLGLGVDIWRFNLEMRYQWGLANLYGTNLVHQDPRAGFRYSGFSVTLGFNFYQKTF